MNLEPQVTEGQPSFQLKEPSSQYFLQEYEINIKFMARGCVIRVGCKEIPFESVETAIAALNKYVQSPAESQEFWRKEFL
jgi:hypothetical protein